MYQLAQQTIQLGIQPKEPMLPDVSLPIVLQAEVLREWNQLDAALELVEEAISLSPQAATIVSITYTVYGYVVLMRIALSRGELDRACSALQEFERIKMKMNQPLSLHFHSFFTIVDQVKLWLACGELDRATRWAQKLDRRGPCGTPFAREREEVARARILLATAQPTGALQRLEPVLQRATAGQRWGHVIEIRLLQALAH
jgi:ATP/maltotriose-dependent transcriptional regulator MalT